MNIDLARATVADSDRRQTRSIGRVEPTERTERRYRADGLHRAARRDVDPNRIVAVDLAEHPLGMEQRLIQLNLHSTSRIRQPDHRPPVAKRNRPAAGGYDTGCFGRLAIDDRRDRDDFGLIAVRRRIRRGEGVLGVDRLEADHDGGDCHRREKNRLSNRRWTETVAPDLHADLRHSLDRVSMLPCAARS